MKFESVRHVVMIFQYSIYSDLDRLYVLPQADYSIAEIEGIDHPRVFVIR